MIKSKLSTLRNGKIELAWINQWALNINTLKSKNTRFSFIGSKPKSLSEKGSVEWDQKNVDAVAYIIFFSIE